MNNAKYISQAIAGAMEIMNDQPLTLNEFIDEVMSDYMEHEPGTYVPLGDMHDQWEKNFNAGEFAAIICARGHLKTTWGLCVLAYYMHKQPNFRALYISATLEQAWDKLEQFEELCKRSWRLSNYLEKSDDKKVTVGFTVRV
jgi:reverse gyrase